MLYWFIQGFLKRPAILQAMPQSAMPHPHVSGPLRDGLCFSGIRQAGMWPSLLARTVQGIMQCPSSFKSGPQCHYGHMLFFRPFCNGLCTPLIRNASIISPVQQLFSLCRPATIFCIIRGVIIQTINRMFWTRAFPHISKEGFKRGPFNSDAAPAIILIAVIVGISTTLHHSSVYAVFFCAMFSMLGKAGAGYLSRQATATPGSSFIQLIAGFDPYGSTRTVTFPQVLPCMVYASIRHDRPSTKRFSRHIDKLRHWYLSVLNGSVWCGSAVPLHGESVPLVNYARVGTTQTNKDTRFA